MITIPIPIPFYDKNTSPYYQVVQCVIVSVLIVMGMYVSVVIGLLLLCFVCATRSLECYSCTALGQCVTPGDILLCQDQDRSCVKQWRDGAGIILPIVIV